MTTPVRSPTAGAAAGAALPGRFAAGDEPVDVAAVVVTYNSADRIDALLDSLRAETVSASIRVVLVDNGSCDGTADSVRRAHPDVVTVEAGGNLGYAGGINAAHARVGECRAVLVLNPDLTLVAGAVAAMLERLDGSCAGIVVPRMLDADGRLYPSQRREPSLAGALGDALFGGRWRSRPGRLTEMVFDPRRYAAPRRVDWATGAALLIRSTVARDVGPWDERYFLYSEETDFCRRAREVGASIWYEPAATVVHAQGASGSSPRLDALSTVNRVRYVRKFHPLPYTAAFHALVVLAEVLRLGRRGHRGTLRATLRPWSWADLARPQAAATGTTFGYLVPEFPGQTHGFFRRELAALERMGAHPTVVSTRPPAGGPGAHAWAASAADRTHYLARWTPGAVLATGAVLLRAMLSGRGRDVAVELRAAAACDGVVRALGLAVAGARLAALARSGGWRHVHVHSCARAAQVALLAHALTGLRYSLSLHGPLADYGGNQRRKWSHASFALVITEELLAEVGHELDGDLPAVVALAPMGIDPDDLVRTHPYRPWTAPGTLRIFSCGRLNPSKGHADLVDAVALLREAGRDVTLVIAGEDEQGGRGYRRELEARITAARLTGAVRLLGTVPEESVRVELQRAHVFVLASLAEPLGVAIMEAMAMEVPVVACAGGGVGALVGDGMTGLLAEPGDPRGLAAAIRRIADTPALARALSARSRQHVVSRFSSDSGARTLLELVERCAAERGRV